MSCDAWSSLSNSLYSVLLSAVNSGLSTRILSPASRSLTAKAPHPAMRDRLMIKNSFRKRTSVVADGVKGKPAGSMAVSSGLLIGSRGFTGGKR